MNSLCTEIVFVCLTPHHIPLPSRATHKHIPLITLFYFIKMLLFSETTVFSLYLYHLYASWGSQLWTPTGAVPKLFPPVVWHPLVGSWRKKTKKQKTVQKWHGGEEGCVDQPPYLPTTSKATPFAVPPVRNIKDGGARAALTAAAQGTHTHTHTHTHTRRCCLHTSVLTHNQAVHVHVLLSPSTPHLNWHRCGENGNTHVLGFGHNLQRVS